NADEDILVAGWTAYDGDVAALTALMSEWTRSASYASRTANIVAGTGATSGYHLTGDAGVGQTAFTDSDLDTLTGSQGQDLFLANLNADNGGPVDTVTDRNANELWNDTDF